MGEAGGGWKGWDSTNKEYAFCGEWCGVGGVGERSEGPYRHSSTGYGMGRGVGDGISTVLALLGSPIGRPVQERRLEESTTNSTGTSGLPRETLLQREATVVTTIISVILAVVVAYALFHACIVIPRERRDAKKLGVNKGGALVTVGSRI